MNIKHLLLFLVIFTAACTSYQFTPQNVTDNATSEVDEGYAVGDTLIVSIPNVNNQGYGIVRLDDLTLLVQDAQEDTTVRVEITQLTKNIGFARILETDVQAPSEEEDISEDILNETEDVIDEIEDEIDEVINETEDIVENISEDEPVMNGNVTVVKEDNVTDEQIRAADVTAYEGETVTLNPNVADPDGDPIELGFTEPFNEEGVWQTQEGDAGFYSVIVTATDNKGSFVSQQMTVLVLSSNQPPVIEMQERLDFEEGDLITLDPQVSDPDGDEVDVSYSGWMTSSTYQTDFDDAGTHEVSIKATDGERTTTQMVTIVVEDVNRPPVLEIEDDDITVTEGELVAIDVSVVDPDGDNVTVGFSGPLNDEGQWETAMGDAGSYTIIVAASDGENSVTEEVALEVLRRNQAPVIDSITVDPQDVVLQRPGDTETIEIDVQAHDADGDDLTVSYSGYMTEATKTVEYGMPGGTKTVTVTVSDGIDAVSQNVTFSMNNWPCFNCQV